jgi:hypothetical protein
MGLIRFYPGATGCSTPSTTEGSKTAAMTTHGTVTLTQKGLRQVQLPLPRAAGRPRSRGRYEGGDTEEGPTIGGNKQQPIRE